MAQKLTTEEFIEKAKIIHDNKYDYSKVDYKNSRTKVEIVCPVHGSFFQRPANHLVGNGCPFCAGKIQKTTDTFIQEAKAIHRNKYDYSKVNYTNAKTKVEIICPIHGSFLQEPDVHLNQKCGCPECGKLTRTMTQRSNTKEFIEKAKVIHGNKYDYSKVNYVNAKTKVEIICNTCDNSFLVTPNNHLRNRGCPFCKITNIQKDKPAHLYYISINNGKYYKIGVTSRSIEERFHMDKDKKFITLLWEYYSKAEDALKKEKEILKKYNKFRLVDAKPLKSLGNTEVFTKNVLGLDKEIKEK